MKARPRSLGWHLLTALILIGLAAGLWYATARIDYQWRWHRVPQYFLYQAEENLRAPVDGEVTAVRPGGQGDVVVLHGADGETREVVVGRGLAAVSPGDEVFEGDIVGTRRGWHLGPLTWGLWTTIWISFLSGVVGLVVGLAAGLARVSRNPTLRSLSVLYVELIRGTPLLVQIFIFYFFIGTVLHLDRVVAGVGALALFAGAYIAEIVRAGIQSVPRGQTEAARSLGMTAGQTMRHIVLPQAFKRILPPLAGQFISLIKDSSLVSVIAITDLTKSGREVITSTFATFEIWFTVAALYLVLTSVLSQAILWMERRLAQSD
ncbi:amino acid ABC transporter permease [Inmirania thermothiophila]|uniref:Putative glutamine transport system permease protein GlnP n=1 Tax=Inmirania thermothiophila TaxID=1750597 RepID=A0A3N1Y1N8_9GAMM|nr:amino acid ABC transporter permease [Inmirania thermothiophila]ROR32744.1 amino acid ABC transporter membrane protein (PAAT family) [Inmirania thermothiophila]